MTFQSSGAVTVKAKVALRSGCSKQANMRRASIDLELGVEVDLLVDRVDEAVQALAGVHVGAVGDDPQLVLGGAGRSARSARRRRRRTSSSAPLSMIDVTRGAMRSMKVSRRPRR